MPPRFEPDEIITGKPDDGLHGAMFCKLCQRGDLLSIFAAVIELEEGEVSINEENVVTIGFADFDLGRVFVAIGEIHAWNVFLVRNAVSCDVTVFMKECHFIVWCDDHVYD